MKAITRTERSMARAPILGVMVLGMLVTGLITKLMVLGSTRGLMGELLKVAGKTTTCMVKVLTLGAMGESMKASIIWIKNMGMVFIIGPMGEGTRDTGQMANRTEKGNTFCQMELLRLDYGKRARGCDG